MQQPIRQNIWSLAELLGKLPQEIMQLDPDEFAEGLAYIVLQNEAIKRAQKKAKTGKS